MNKNIIKGIKIILFNIIDDKIIILPNAKDPVSPRNIFAGWEFKNKNPIKEPIILNKNNPYI